jgi:pyruvate formate lyase activating enzyme
MSTAGAAREAAAEHPVTPQTGTDSGAAQVLPSRQLGEVRGRVARILPFSAVDGPGNRSVVFLQGCDFDCRYCHNPETRSFDPGAPSYAARDMSVAEVFAELGEYRSFISGLTVSGGECTLQPDFLHALLSAAREAGLSAFVDTNGSIDFSQHTDIVDASDAFMLDVKAWDEAGHRALTGVGNRRVLENLSYLAKAGKLYEVRTVILDGIFDARTTVIETSRVLAAIDPSIRYKLIRFRPHGVREEYKALPQPSDALMYELVALARQEGLTEMVLV